MAGNSELMDIIKKNVDNHHAKLSDSLLEKWLELDELKTESQRFTCLW